MILLVFILVTSSVFTVKCDGIWEEVDGYIVETEDGIEVEDGMSDGYIVDNGQKYILEDSDKHGDIVDNDELVKSSLDILPASRQDIVSCPSTDVIRTRASCRAGDQWIDCYRDSCCPKHTLVVGRCIPDSEDPCSDKYEICEQQCSTYFGRVICTCFTGFKFNKTRLSNGIVPYCLDEDECQEDNGGCEHECINTEGGHECQCKDGVTLQDDETSCTNSSNVEVPHVDPEEGTNGSGQVNLTAEAAFRPKAAIRRLQRTVNRLQEKLRALNSAVKLYSFAGGSPGPEGPQGPPGPPGPRGFPGPAGGGGGDDDSILESNEVDSYVTLSTPSKSSRGGKKGKRGQEEQFCKCTRGPVGPPGANGERGARGFRGEQGLRGPKGAEGSFDFLMAMMKDVRTDIEFLMDKVKKKNKKDLDSRRFGGRGRHDKSP